MRRALLAVFLSVAALTCALACSPPHEGAGTPLPVEPAVKATCILLRLTRDARVDEVCATAEELAPFVPDIIAARAEADAGPDEIDGPILAFGVPDVCAKPKRRRRSAKDAGALVVVVSSADAGARNARDAGSDGAPW